MSDKIKKPDPSTVNYYEGSDDQLLRTLYDAGFTNPQSLRQAYAIAKTESNGRSAAFNGERATGDRSLGMFQINMLGDLGVDRDAKFRKYVKGYNDETDLFNPLINARAAAYMTQQKKGNNTWGSWSKDLTSDRYLNALPGVGAINRTIAGFQKADQGMKFLNDRKTNFNEGAEAMGLPKLQNPYGGSYKIPGNYRSDPDTATPTQKFTTSHGIGSVGKVTGPSANNIGKSTGNIGDDNTINDDKSWLDVGISALKSSPQFETVGLGSQTFGKVY